jgi:cell wall assembly regulator SMI1
VTPDPTATIAALVSRISEKLVELDQLTEFEMDHPLGAPASPADIADFERRIGFTLPDDYKAFLRLHDGWGNFSGENALLSIAEMSDGELHDHVTGFQEEMQAGGENALSQGLIFEASFTTRFSYFDRAGQAQSGRLEVVYWNKRVLERYASFTDYLADYEKTLDKFIADERANQR